MQAACETARTEWVSALQHLLSQAPATAADAQLWLHLLPVINRLLDTHAVKGPALQLLAFALRQAALPVLGSQQASTGTPSLPLALTRHADATSMFGQAHEQLRGIQVTQVRLDWNVSVIHLTLRPDCVNVNAIVTLILIANVMTVTLTANVFITVIVTAIVTMIVAVAIMITTN